MVVIYKKYRIIQDENKWRVAENFGDYRILKKKFKNIDQAKNKIDLIGDK